MNATYILRQINATNILRKINDGCLKLRRVVIVSYPKSGRTWLRMMLNDLNINPAFDHSTSKIAKRRDATNVCDGMDKYFRNKVVFLMRDPRDVVVSYYLQASSPRKNEYSGDLKEFIRDPLCGFEKILAFNRGWYKARSAFNGFFPVTYEQIKDDTHAKIREIVSFMGIPRITDTLIENAVAQNNFSRMKKREASGELYRRFGEMFADGTHSNEEFFKVRRGKIGGYRNYMDEEDQEYCARMIEEYDYKGILSEFSGTVATSTLFHTPTTKSVHARS